MKKLDHLSEIYKSYDTFIIDLWGVMHNGIQLYPDAIKTIEGLDSKKKKIIFLSNAPRPCKDVINFLRNMNMSKKFLKNIMTSGEAAVSAIKNKKFGEFFFHLGPKRDETIFKDLEQNKTDLKNCDFILCTGMFDEHEDIDYYKNLLKNNIKKKLICTNPDLTVHKGDREEYCAGKVAEIYENLGGKVIYFGKPHKEVYKHIILKNEKNLIIGDNLRTDIKGANNLNIDSLFITNGVHRNELGKDKDINLLLNKYKVTTKYFQTNLSW